MVRIISETRDLACTKYTLAEFHVQAAFFEALKHFVEDDEMLVERLRPGKDIYIIKVRLADVAEVVGDCSHAAIKHDWNVRQPHW